MAVALADRLTRRGHLLERLLNGADPDAQLVGYLAHGHDLDRLKRILDDNRLLFDLRQIDALRGLRRRAFPNLNRCATRPLSAPSRTPSIRDFAPLDRGRVASHTYARTHLIYIVRDHPEVRRVSLERLCILRT